MLRKSILEYRNKSLQTQHSLHIDHCLTALREDILCNADDTPRYTGGDHTQAGSGQDQVRLCRDWAKLDEWAKKWTACYREPELGDNIQYVVISLYDSRKIAKNTPKIAKTLIFKILLNILTLD
jgi:hypothetical protein